MDGLLTLFILFMGYKIIESKAKSKKSYKKPTATFTTTPIKPLTPAIEKPKKTLFTNLEKTEYYKSTYYQITKNSYESAIKDTGKNGEYMIYKQIKHFEQSGGKLLFNCYLPKDNKTTEIDVMLICYYGIFVFESKNYGGWIFGDEQADVWTQTLPAKRRTSRKEHFYNPIKQNRTHIEYLKKQIGNDIPIYSIIVFSDNCTFKNVPQSNLEYEIIHLNQLVNTINRTIASKINILDIEKVNQIYNILYPYTQVSDEVKKQHINDIKKLKRAYKKNAQNP